jgi:hypothetical protein
MAVVIGTRVVGCDLFDKPSTCGKVWDRLLSGLVFDALAENQSSETAETKEIEWFLQTARDAEWRPTIPVGEGDEYRAKFGDGDQASALTFQNSLLHGSVLARE